MCQLITPVMGNEFHGRVRTRYIPLIAKGWRKMRKTFRRHFLSAAVCALAVHPALPAESPVMYRCPGNDYNNKISAAEAITRGCKPLEPAEWVEYARDQKETVYEYNVPRTNFRKGYGEVETWVQVRLASPDTLTWPNGRKASYSRTVTLTSVQCNAGTMAAGVRYFYDASGGSVWTDESFKPQLAPPPNSIGEVLVRQLCADLGAKSK